MLLVELKADPEIANLRQNTALHFAYMCEHVDVIEFLESVELASLTAALKGATSPASAGTGGGDGGGDAGAICRCAADCAALVVCGDAGAGVCATASVLLQLSERRSIQHLRRTGSRMAFCSGSKQS